MGADGRLNARLYNPNVGFLLTIGLQSGLHNMTDHQARK